MDGSGRKLILMEIEKFWQEFQASSGLDLSSARYDAWQFGDNPDKLLDLVLMGKKQATASLHESYVLENEPIPEIGTYSIILDSNNEPRCIIQNTEVLLQPFNDYDSEFAFLEGEGDQSYSYWRDVHIEFFTNECRRHGLEFNEDMLVVGEIFQLIYKK